MHARPPSSVNNNRYFLPSFTSFSVRRTARLINILHAYPYERECNALCVYTFRHCVSRIPGDRFRWQWYFYFDRLKEKKNPPPGEPRESYLFVGFSRIACLRLVKSAKKKKEGGCRNEHIRFQSTVTYKTLKCPLIFMRYSWCTRKTERRSRCTAVYSRAIFSNRFDFFSTRTHCCSLFNLTYL